MSKKRSTPCNNNNNNNNINNNINNNSSSNKTFGGTATTSTATTTTTKATTFHIIVVIVLISQPIQTERWQWRTLADVELVRPSSPSSPSFSSPSSSSSSSSSSASHSSKHQNPNNTSSPPQAQPHFTYLLQNPNELHLPPKQILKTPEDCQFLVGFTKEQQQICGRSLELMNYVLEGVVESIQACRAEFEGERWNCSSGLESGNSGGRVVEAGGVEGANAEVESPFSALVKKGTRETAFLYAILSAGVTHKVTKACSSGRLKNCGCDRTLTGQEEWSGCSDNVAYGKAFARSLIDVREELVGMSHPSRALLNLHNNNAGRKTVELSMRTHCRCHGVSGACEMKTCWKTLPPFDDVSKRLKINYDNSKMVKLKKAGSQMDFAVVSGGKRGKKNGADDGKNKKRKNNKNNNNNRIINFNNNNNNEESNNNFNNNNNNDNKITMNSRKVIVDESRTNDTATPTKDYYRPSVVVDGVENVTSTGLNMLNNDNDDTNTNSVNTVATTLATNLISSTIVVSDIPSLHNSSSSNNNIINNNNNININNINNNNNNNNDNTNNDNDVMGSSPSSTQNNFRIKAKSKPQKLQQQHNMQHKNQQSLLKRKRRKQQNVWQQQPQQQPQQKQQQHQPKRQPQRQLPQRRQHQKRQPQRNKRNYEWTYYSKRNSQQPDSNKHSNNIKNINRFYGNKRYLSRDMLENRDYSNYNVDDDGENDAGVNDFENDEMTDRMLYHRQKNHRIKNFDSQSYYYDNNYSSNNYNNFHRNRKYQSNSDDYQIVNQPPVVRNKQQRQPQQYKKVIQQERYIDNTRLQQFNQHPNNIHNYRNDQYFNNLTPKQSRHQSHHNNHQQPQQQQPHSFNETDLLFTHASPSYCDLDLSRGSLGTSGRLCSNDKTATTDSCKVLCCGRGYVVVGEVTLVEKCQCKFHWCCRVECQECKRRVEVYRCK